MTRAGRVAVSGLGVAALVAGAALLTGGRGWPIGAMLALPWVAWRHDNATGTCLPLSLLFLLAVGVMIALIYLLVVTHRG